MTSNNAVSIILLFIIIGIIVYFYFNHVQTDANKQHRVPKKRLRFNPKLTYIPNRRKEIDVDSIIKSPNQEQSINLDEILSESIIKEKTEAKKKKANLQKSSIACSTFSQPRSSSGTELPVDPQSTGSWHEYFDKPLMDAGDKKKFFSKIKSDYLSHEKAFGEYVKHQTDDNIIIKTDTTIDPFKPEKRNNKSKGRAIKDIYDEMVANPKAKPKAIDTGVVYQDGSKLSGFDSIHDGYRTANFGDDF